MSKESRFADWWRRRWLEVLLMVGLLGLLGWYASVGVGFMPQPTPTPSPRPPTATRAALAPTRRPVAAATATPRPSVTAPVATPLPTRTPSPRPSAVPAATATRAAGDFEGATAYEDVLAQMKIGARPAGSDGNRRVQEYI